MTCTITNAEDSQIVSDSIDKAVRGGDLVNWLTKAEDMELEVYEALLILVGHDSFEDHTYHHDCVKVLLTNSWSEDILSFTFDQIANPAEARKKIVADKAEKLRLENIILAERTNNRLAKEAALLEESERSELARLMEKYNG